ncbi:MAG TPA: hypothetical protein VEJ86_14605 [Candidatus Binataceae bacterium]|nr:hypothetical protein [Candidatus Binataceae bacterium]
MRCAIFSATALILIGGCAVQGRPFEKVPATPSTAVIYVYRPYHYGSSLLRPPVTCGDEAARIGPGGYHAFVVPAGKTTCEVETETADQVDVDAQPGSYYIREEFGWGALTGHPHLNPIDHDEAQTEIGKCCVQEEPQAGPTP